MALIPVPSDPISGGEALAGQIVSALQGWFPTAADKEKAQIAVLQTLQASDAAQTDVNKQEAASTSLFVAGWRPAIGWICAAALAYQYVIVPVSVWASYAAGHPFPKPPTLDDTLWQLMFGMLGMGGLRTFEKLKGVAGNH
jgi:Holin of 3TMs, for gene-transfer release